MNIFLEKILIGIGGHFAVGCEVAGFCAKNELIARVAFGFQLHQGSANAAFAALKAIIDRSVGDIDPGFDGAHDGCGVGGVGALVGLAEIGADTDG